MFLERISLSGERSWEWFKQRAHGPHALWWLIGASLLEPIISPVVPETLLVAILLAGAKRWKFYTTVTAIASIVGGIIGYAIGALLFGAIGAWLLSIGGVESAFVSAQHLMQKHVFATMILASFTPLPDKAFVLAGGFLGVSFIPFILGYSLGRTVRFIIVAYLIKLYGDQIVATINKYFNLLALAALVALALIALLFFDIL